MGMLQDPIVPVADTRSLDYVAKGLAGMMANRRYQQNYELAQQKMVQDAALDQQKFELAREQVANQYEVQQAQIGNLHSQENYHNAQAAFVETTKTDTANEKQLLLNRTAEFTSKASRIKGSDVFGTAAGDTALSALIEEYADISGVPAGARQLSSFTVGQRMAKSQKAAAIYKLGTDLDKQMLAKGITPAHLDDLEMDEKGRFKQGGRWGVNDDGSPFIAMEESEDPTKSGPTILTPDEVKAKTGQKHRPINYVTLTPTEAKIAKYSKKKIDDFHAQTAGMPPPDAVGEVIQNEAYKSQAQLAEQWARDHPEDPRSAAILKKIGVQ